MARLESDSMGAIEVPDQHYWGAQTQRSIHYFRFGQAMPLELVHAFGALKAACAEVNQAKGRLAPRAGGPDRGGSRGGGKRLPGQ